MNKVQQIILNEIHQAKIITIFRHINPDHDALGSQNGLKAFLKGRYPLKQVYACGFDDQIKGIEYPSSDQIPDEVIEASLAIVLDSANTERIDDQRYKLAHKIIKIDHHPDLDQYGDIQWVDTDYSSTSEMMSELLQALNKKPLDKEVATYLMAGMISDTIMFSIKSTRSETLRQAAYLLESDISINAIHQAIYNVSLKDFNFINFVRSKAKLYHNSILIAMISLKDLAKFNLHPNLAKEYVYALANIEEVEVWGLFIEREVDEISCFNGSLRSKRLAINELASQYNGGGHPLASAVKHIKKAEVMELIDTMAIRLKEETDEN